MKGLITYRLLLFSKTKLFECIWMFYLGPKKHFTSSVEDQSIVSWLLRKISKSNIYRFTLMFLSSSRKRQKKKKRKRKKKTSLILGIYSTIMEPLKVLNFKIIWKSVRVITNAIKYNKILSLKSDIVLLFIIYTMKCNEIQLKSDSVF